MQKVGKCYHIFFSIAYPKSFVLDRLAKNCQCQCCNEKLEKVKKIDGVHSLSIDVKKGQMTISGTVDPQKVIGYLEKHNKQAKLVPERNNHNVQIIVLPQPVIVQEFNDQNLVAQVRELAKNVKGLEQLEITYTKNVKLTTNGKNKDEENLEKVKKIDGVHSLSIDPKTWKMTIWGTVDPQKVIKYLEKHNKQAKLVPEEIPPKRNNQYWELEQVEITYTKYTENVKVTINRKNKDEGDCCDGQDTGTSSGGRRPHGKDIIPRHWSRDGDYRLIRPLVPIVTGTLHV
ncbi:hypothetical protein RHSIM_Rhsim13G0023100 [Rhododendron simsii]|uniref:HMA domain-containing protein n=1 Tax=Rhododendron simsii TaxID=118357 RepID=A0A834G5W0_RHOSS|nr:hypothetical protein RHSIM_Rhsim13G0023100 [Rhododendron simsii]